MYLVVNHHRCHRSVICVYEPIVTDESLIMYIKPAGTFQHLHILSNVVLHIICSTVPPTHNILGQHPGTLEFYLGQLPSEC
jgi:hypothetical protein